MPTCAPVGLEAFQRVDEDDLRRVAELYVVVKEETRVGREPVKARSCLDVLRRSCDNHARRHREAEFVHHAVARCEQAVEREFDVVYLVLEELRACVCFEDVV